MNRIITVNCAGETIKKSSSFAGAAGSHNAVTLRFSFSPEWDGTTKKIIFYNALGGNPVYRLCTVNCLTPDASDSYDIPIPGEAMEFEGDMIVTISGVNLAEGGETAERIIRALNTTFNVGAASTPSSDVEPAEPTATQAEQLQGQIDHVLQSIVDAMNAAAAAHVSEVNAAGSAASASGSASAASGSATAAASSASSAAGSASAAAAAKDDVAASALAAAGSASAASTSATTASAKASEAATSATAAASSATTATTKASEAASAKTAAESAQSGAISAKNDAITAKTAAETARAGAETARDLAVTAKNDSTTARTAAETAQGLSEGARDDSITAKNQSVTAKTAAETAQGLAQAAKAGADAAKAGAETAETGAESARDIATTAKNDAVTAKNAAQTAQTAAETAKGLAETARTAAQTSATTSGNRALDSEAFGAGTRNGAAVIVGDPAYQNNAKWYKDQAGEIVGGDFATKTESQGYANTAESNAKSYADTQIAAIPPVDISGKADKTYVDNKVKTDVPPGAVFTDTVYTHPTVAGNKHIPTGGASGQILRYSAIGTAIWGTDNDTITTVNGKTGAIVKADIVALGIPAQDTVYTHPANHTPSIITQDASNRFVTDAEKAAWNGKANPPTAVTATLSTTWAGSGPYTQSVTVSGVTSTNNITVSLASTATEAQRNAARDALLSATAQATNSITVTADGDKPTVALPIQALILGG